MIPDENTKCSQNRHPNKLFHQPDTLRDSDAHRVKHKYNDAYNAQRIGTETVAADRVDDARVSTSSEYTVQKLASRVPTWVYDELTLSFQILQTN